MNKCFLPAITLLVFSGFHQKAFCQKTITEQQLVWFGYFFTYQHNEKSYIQVELQERFYTTNSAQHQFLLRGHYHRLIKNTNWEYSIGGCYFLQSPNDPTAKNKLQVPELRPHIGFGNKENIKKLSIDYRYRFEARYFHQVNSDRTSLEDGYEFSNFRFRFRMQLSYPLTDLWEKSRLKIKASNEIHLNLGEQIVNNTFEQNRIYLGLSLELNKQLTIDAGYLNWFQQRSNGEFFDRDIMRFTMYHKIKRTAKA